MNSLIFKYVVFLLKYNYRHALFEYFEVTSYIKSLLHLEDAQKIVTRL